MKNTYTLIYGYTMEEEYDYMIELSTDYPDIHILKGNEHLWINSTSITKLLTFMEDNFDLTEDITESININLEFTKEIELNA